MALQEFQPAELLPDEAKRDSAVVEKVLRILLPADNPLVFDWQDLPGDELQRYINTLNPRSLRRALRALRRRIPLRHGRLRTFVKMDDSEAGRLLATIRERPRGTAEATLAALMDRVLACYADDPRVQDQLAKHGR